MHISGEQGNIRDVSPEIVNGFTSKNSCEEAARVISSNLVVMVGKARDKQGIKSNLSTQSPAIWTECIEVIK